MVPVFVDVVYKSLLHLLEQKIIFECKEKTKIKTQGCPGLLPREHIQCYKTTSPFTLSFSLNLHEITKAERREFVLNFK